MKTYRELAAKILQDRQIKIESDYVQNGEYSKYALYVNRIANGNKPKFRVLKDGDKVKNCLKITFNFDLHEREYMRLFIESKVKLMAHLSHGSCHRFLNISILSEILSGIIAPNGLPTEEAKKMLA